MSVTWTVKAHVGYAVATFELPGGLIEPAALPAVSLPDGLDRTKGLVISGRGPVWLYAHLVHEAHPFAWVATHDPRLGYVVVQRHHVTAPRVGEVITP